MNVTTIKQSVILVNNGVDPATADFAYILNPIDGQHILSATKVMTKDDLPCWSMGALWEICHKRKIALEFLTDEDSAEIVLDTMVDTIVDDIKENGNE